MTATSTVPATAAAVPRSTWRRDLGLAAWQIRYEQRSYWRNRGRGLFTFVMPIMLLVIFASLDQGQHISSRGQIPLDDFFVPGILAYGIIMTTFINLAISTALLRDVGVLKRMQGTPLPRWAYMAARIGSTWIITGVMTIVVLGLGVTVYGLTLRPDMIPELVLALLLGSAAFTTIGIGIVRLLPSADSAPLVNIIILPITFISNIWFPVDSLPHVLKQIADIFPIKALADALQFAFDPRQHGLHLDGTSLRTLVIWTAVGVWLMVRFLRQPQGEVA